MKKRYLTVSELAEESGLSVYQIERLLASGLPCVQFCNRGRRYIDRRQFDDHMAARVGGADGLVNPPGRIA